MNKYCDICGNVLRSFDALTGCAGHGGGDEHEVTWPPLDLTIDERVEKLRNQIAYQRKKNNPVVDDVETIVNEVFGEDDGN